LYLSKKKSGGKTTFWGLGGRLGQELFGALIHLIRTTKKKETNKKPPRNWKLGRDPFGPNYWTKNQFVKPFPGKRVSSLQNFPIISTELFTQKFQLLTEIY